MRIDYLTSDRCCILNNQVYLDMIISTPQMGVIFFFSPKNLDEWLLSRVDEVSFSKESFSKRNYLQIKTITASMKHALLQPPGEQFWSVKEAPGFCVLFGSAYLVNVPVAELGWYLNLMRVSVHGEVEVSAEPLQLHAVPLLVVEQTSQSDEKLPPGG